MHVDEAAVAHDRLEVEYQIADWQLAVFQKTRDLKTVVDSLIVATAEGVGLDSPLPF